MTTIDFGKALADAKSASFEAMPIGDYNIEVVSADAVTASTGRPMIKCKMKVIDGAYTNRPVMTQFVLVIDNPNALSMFFRNMRGFGIEESFFAQLGNMASLDPVAAALVGRRAQVTLGIRQWQGEDRNEVTGIKKYTGAPGTVQGAPGGPVPPSMPGMPPAVGPQFAAQPPAPQAPQMVPTAPPIAAQSPAQPAAPATPPVASSVPPAPVQAPVAPASASQSVSLSNTAADIAQLVAAEVTEAQTSQIPTAAETAPPVYAQPEVQQYVTSDAQAMPVPPTSPI